MSTSTSLGLLLRVQNFGDAEIEQLGSPSGRDQDVRRLQIAVHHELFVRVLDCLGDLAEESQALLSGKTVLVAVFVDAQNLRRTP